MSFPSRSPHAEVITLDLSDFDSETGAHKVRGKGNKERVVYLTNGGLDAVLDWLAERLDEPGTLLYAIRKV